MVSAVPALPTGTHPPSRGAEALGGPILKELRLPSCTIAKVGVLSAAPMQIQAFEREADGADVVAKTSLGENLRVRVTRDDGVDGLAKTVANKLQSEVMNEKIGMSQTRTRGELRPLWRAKLTSSMLPPCSLGSAHPFSEVEC